MRRVLSVLALLVAMSGMVVASPRAGANHRTGDDSFVETFGRAPDARDSEELRMHTHLAWIRARLGATHATSPALESRRAELLGYLDEYIAKGVTPKNTHVPWRSPVFIDRQGNVCAVGYLIERSAGRELAEQIAATHRTSFLEDIAAAEPVVRDWIAASGFTLDELASIQPAYQEPAIDTWRIWAAKYRPDGVYDVEGITGTGMLKKHQMEGAWKVLDEGGTTLGTGEMKSGSGAWTSYYPNGAKRAEGRYARSVAEGTWRIYHPSGNLAAEGRLEGGVRTGTWRLYHDTKDRTLLARGRFAADGAVTGRWKHFDAEGNLVARTWEETPRQWNDRTLRTTGGLGYTIAVVPKDGFVENHHIGMPHARVVHTSVLTKGDDKLVTFEIEGVMFMFDVEGHQLVRDEEGRWTRGSCHWSQKRKAVARGGDAARLSGLLFNDYARMADGVLDDFGGGYSGDYKPACDAATAVVHADRAKRLEALLAARAAVHAPVAFTQVIAGDPQAARDDADDDDDVDRGDSYDAEDDADKKDLVDILVGGTAMYAEWMHVDGVFEGLYATIPGRFVHHWAGSNPEEGYFATGE